MSDVGPDNLVLTMLRRMDQKLDRIDQRFDDLTARVGSREEQIAGLRKDFVQLQHVDHFDERLKRVEKRLDLIEA